MKKNLFFTVVLASMLLTSCSNENGISSNELSIENVQSATTQNETVSEIRSINTEIFRLRSEYTDNQLTTRGFWRNLFKIVFADAKGFLTTGSITKSAAASIDKYEELYLKDNPTPSDNNGKGGTPTTTTPSTGTSSNADCTLVYTGNSITSSVNNTTYKLTDEEKESMRLWNITNKNTQEAGIIHNQIVGNIVFDKDKIKYWAVNGDNSRLCAVMSLEASENVLSLPKGYLSNDSLKINEMSAYIKSLKNNSKEDVDDYIARLTVTNPEEAELVKVLKNYIEGLDGIASEEDLKPYSEEVVRIINNSNLSQDRKDEICRGISVGFASFKLWNETSIITYVNSK